MKSFTLLSAIKKMNTMKHPYILRFFFALLLLGGFFAGSTVKAQSFRTVTFTGAIGDFTAGEQFAYH